MKRSKKHKRTHENSLLDFFAELGQLKRVARSGWWTAGIIHPESVADHSFRCAAIGFCIAHREQVDPYRTALICLFNDVHEARINDLHKVVQRYIPLRQAEKKAASEQVASLPHDMGRELHGLLEELWADETPESRVARDADILECMIQGKEYFEQGFLQAEEFFTRAHGLLKTKTAKRLAQELRTWDPRAWCSRLATLQR